MLNNLTVPFLIWHTLANIEFNGRSYPVIPNSDRYNKIGWVIMCVLLYSDVVVSILLRVSPSWLPVIEKLLEPINFLFIAFGVPITSSFFESSEPASYYRLLMLLSALAGLSLNIFLALQFLLNNKFLSKPSFFAVEHKKVLEERFGRQKGSVIFYYYFSPVAYLGLILLGIKAVTVAYPGLYTFHPHDIFVAVLFSILVAFVWSPVLWCVLAISSHLISFLSTFKNIFGH